MINRIGEDRMNVLKRRGGSEATEAAVLGGLRWLKKTQNQDGSWGDEYKASMTGLSLLAFLGHGEDQTSPEFGPAVGGAVEWLRVAGRDFEGRLSLTKDGWGSGMGAVYEHAIATYALADYYGLTGDARVEPLLRQAIGHIVAGQAPDGGWNYGYAKKPNSDTSVSGWQIQALISAHHSRLVIKGVDEALDKAMVNFKRVHSEDGNFHYQKLGDRGDNSSLAGVGALCSAVWHTGGSERLGNKGAKFLLESNRRGLDYRSETADLYAWYYHAQACSAVGGTPWTKWNRLFRDVIVNAQSPEGNWPPTQGRSPGGELQRKPDGAGPVYRTALCVLMLETYYRNVF